MKITQVETIVINMPMQLAGDVPMQGGQARTSIDMLLVRVDTDAGVSGWGEGFGHRIWPATRAALDTFIGPMCVGRDATAINALIDELQRNLHGVGRSGPAMYALSAIDIALWDIAGKVANLPLYRLLGGSPRTDLPAYASLLRYNTPAAVTRYTAQALQRGYRYIKLHQIDVPSVQAARDVAGPDIPITIDTNCPWTVDEAIAMARAFQPLHPMWLEEPVWPPEDHAGLARVRAAGGLAIAAGENATTSDFKRMFELGSVTYAQPSVTKVGGVTEMRKVMTLAQTSGVQVVPHSAYFGPGLIASIHCIAAMPRESLVERYDCDFEVNPLHEAIQPCAGRIAVPQGPGLGVEPDPEVLKRLRVS
ncbi:MAG: mandelate racemase/muconate lactonizing enzyme family protein [Candidatus Tectomicrobia bacterium]|uniref:Mandelate racemase/muconate lactonizing enzyme family protein n=1 Tax=Tectimicrobiota bacterium TaxID=2528274 RepID=A0A937W2J8_UNCTE|nr:mandelate racemase/muconate lactonizing enzyme family protein [Candidatus Tectomicrobia bacterium]